METNENHKMTKAEQHYQCRPLVKQRDDLLLKIEALEAKIRSLELDLKVYQWRRGR